MYEYKKITWNINSPAVLFLRLTREYGVPKWWCNQLHHILSKLQELPHKKTSNFVLAEWISQGINIIPKETNDMSFLFGEIGSDFEVYKETKGSYSQSNIHVLLHTFPFSEKFVYELLDEATKCERPDLSIVIEQFINEMEWNNENSFDRFDL